MEEITHTLTELGLTEIQSKVLLTLQKFDYASASDLAKHMKIHRQEIYPVLTELHKSGLIERKIGIPNEYKTMPLNKILNILLERKTSWMNELQKTTINLIKKADFDIKKSINKDYDFTLITGIERFSGALKEWTENATTIDYVLLNDRFSRQVAERLHTSEIKYGDAVKIREVTNANPQEVFELRALLPKVDIRFTKLEIPVDIAIYNGNRAHLAIFSNRENIMQTDVSALTSNNPCFVKMFQNYFDILWKNAKSIKTPKQKKPVKALT